MRIIRGAVELVQGVVLVLMAGIVLPLTDKRKARARAAWERHQETGRAA